MINKKLYGTIAGNGKNIPAIMINEITWENKDKEQFPNIGPRIYNKPVIDIRSWNGNTPLEGVVMTYPMIIAFVQALIDDKSNEVNIENDKFKVNKLYGIIAKGKSSLLLTETHMVNKEKKMYDLRYWKGEYAEYSEGISFGIIEAQALFNIFCGIIDEKGKFPIIEKTNKKIQEYTLDNYIDTYILKNRAFYLITKKTAIKKQIENNINELLKK